jgi:LysM repeat protein
MGRIQVTLFLTFCFIVNLYSNEYIVQKNDTLWNIAKNHNSNPDVIANMNGLKNKKLRIGDRLYIPESILAYTVQDGDSLLQIAKDKNSKLDWIIHMNNLSGPVIYPGMKIKVPVMENMPSSDSPIKLNHQPISDNYSFYTVKKGDSLSSISKNYNSTVSAILEVNHTKNKVLYIGETIKIPINKNPVQNQVISSDETKPDAVSIEKSYCFPFNRNIIDTLKPSSRGIVFYLKDNTEIKSINNGVVEYAGKMTGYNNVIIIKYGNNLRAVYGYMNQIHVVKDSTVQKNQVIGAIEKLSFLGHIEFYFEIRKGKNTLNLTDLYPFLKNEQYLVKK